MRVLLLSLLMSACVSVGAQSIEFASEQQARTVLTTRDDFIAHLSPFDRKVRLKTDRDVSEQEFLDFVGRSVLSWTPDEQHLVETTWTSLQPALAHLGPLPFPKTILFIKTSGEEEDGAEYTRSNAIILPQPLFVRVRKADDMQPVLAHELFHILSRNAPDLRDRAYAAIGFQRCAEIAFPPDLASRKLTDPDAPLNDHAIQVRVSGRGIWAVPILYSKYPDYDPAKGTTLFDYLQFRFLEVQRSGDPPPGHRAPIDPARILGFYEQVGRNTEYVIHPEEILADNFRFLLAGTPNHPSPDVLKQLAAALKQ